MTTNPTPDIELDPQIIIRRLEKHNRKLVERINRISNLCIGNQRIYRIDEVVVTLETDSELAREDGETEVALHLSDLALFMERIAYDLGDLRLAIRDEQPKNVGRVDYTTGKYDPDNWRGPRP